VSSPGFNFSIFSLHFQANLWDVDEEGAVAVVVVVVVAVDLHLSSFLWHVVVSYAARISGWF